MILNNVLITERPKIDVEISPNAYLLADMIDFMFPNDEEKQKLNEKCEKMRGWQLFSYLNKLREKRLKANCFASINSFIAAYNSKPKESLERLCQEPIDEIKLKLLKLTDPIQIYMLHRETKSGRFMQLVWSQDES